MINNIDNSKKHQNKSPQLHICTSTDIYQPLKNASKASMPGAKCDL